MLGTAVLGSVLTASYRANLTVPAVARFGEQDSAFETLGGTMEQARFFPNVVGEELVLSAHAAFENAVQLTSAVGDRPRARRRLGQLADAAAARPSTEPVIGSGPCVWWSPLPARRWRCSAPAAGTTPCRAPRA